MSLIMENRVYIFQSGSGTPCSSIGGTLSDLTLLFGGNVSRKEREGRHPLLSK